MDRLRIALAGALVVSIALPSAAQPPTGGPANAGRGTTSPIPPKDAPPPKPGTAGPYKVIEEANPGLMTHTLYRPEDLKPFTGNRRLPIIAWGNGACSNAGRLFETFLVDIASHGYFIVASGPKDAPLPAFAAARPAQIGPATIAKAGDPPQPMTKDADMQTGINWAIAQNADKSSPYYGKLDPSKIAVMGQSCGGLQATANAVDPRVKAVIIWNSGLFPDGTTGVGLSGATKATLAKIHTPIAYFNGGPADAAYLNANDDVSRINQVPVFEAWLNVGHFGTYDHPNGGRFGDVGVAWLDWQLKGDKTAGKVFEGKDCGLCKDSVWHIETKKMID